jgi:hypothetical protein
VSRYIQPVRDSWERSRSASISQPLASPANSKPPETSTTVHHSGLEIAEGFWRAAASDPIRPARPDAVVFGLLRALEMKHLRYFMIYFPLKPYRNMIPGWNTAVARLLPVELTAAFMVLA